MDRLASGQWRYIAGFLVVVLIALAVVFLPREEAGDNPESGGADSGVAVAQSAAAEASPNNVEGDGTALGNPNPLGEIALGRDDAPVTIVE